MTTAAPTFVTGPPAADPPVTRRDRMQVRKRNGDSEPVDVNKIVRAVERWAEDLTDVDPMRVATRTISGLYDGATTAELDQLSIRTAAEMIGEEPQYSRLAPTPRASSATRPHASSRTTPASSTSPSTTAPMRASSTSACAPSTTATCC